MPKSVIEKCGFGNEVEMEVRRYGLVICSARQSREGWDRAFALMCEQGGDGLLD